MFEKYIALLYHLHNFNEEFINNMQNKDYVNSRTAVYLCKQLSLFTFS